MENLTALFHTLLRAGYNGRNSASFIGNLVALSLMAGCTDKDFQYLVDCISKAATYGQLSSEQARAVLELAPGMSQEIADFYGLTIGQLRSTFARTTFEAVFHVVIDSRAKH